jgi:STE24 endopeptidase
VGLFFSLSFGRHRTMQLLLIVAVLAALGVSQYGPQEPVAWPMVRLAVAAGAIGLVGLFAWTASMVTARQLGADFSRHRVVLRRFLVLRRVHTVLWLVAAGVILFGLGWGQLVRFNWHLERAMLADELLILLPIVLPLVLSWSAFYEVDRAIQLAGGRPVDTWRRQSSRRRYLWLHVRHYLGILLVPVLAMLAVQDGIALFAPELLESGREAIVFLPALGLLFLLFPSLLRHVWQTLPLEPGPVRSRLESLAGRSGVRAREILVWQTDGMMVNAAVSGMVWPLRYVFLSDGLLSRMNEEQIEAVFSHEVGHVRHHHLLLRLAAMSVPLSVWLLLQQAYPTAMGQLFDLTHGGPLGVQIPLGLGLAAAVSTYVLVLFGYYSRQLEHQADLFGCRAVAADSHQQKTAVFTGTLEKLAICGGISRNTGSWQHASIARRVDFLGNLSREPKRELHFQRRVRVLNGLILSTLVSPLVYQFLFG